MNNKKDDSYYLEKINENIGFIIQYSKGVSYDEFAHDEKLIDATMFRLIQMVENIKGLSEGFKDSHSSIPWGSIIGFRNGIVHDYGNTDYSIVYEIISKDIYSLKDLMCSIKANQI